MDHPNSAEIALTVPEVVGVSALLRLISDTLEGRVLVEMCDEPHESGARCALDPHHVADHVSRDGRHRWLED